MSAGDLDFELKKMLGAWFCSYYHIPTPELLQIYIATGDIPASPELNKSDVHLAATNFKVI